MRAYHILPKTIDLGSLNLSRDALRRLTWIDWYYTHNKNAEAVCRHFNISKSVFYRWKNRFNKYNLQSLEFNTKLRRPHKLREMTTPVWILQKIYDIRMADQEKSKYEIQEELKREGILVGQQAIQKVINRHSELANLNHKKRVRKHRNFKIARIRAARELREKYPGSLIQIDTKYLYISGIRFYLFVAIDCKSRYAYIWAYKTCSSLSSADFLMRVIDYFPFNINAINTDNGPEYLLNFHKTCTKLGITHYFNYPHTPKMNGRAERLIQTAEYEFFNYQDDLLPDLDQVNIRCEIFNDKYNNHRFNRAINYLTPHEFLLNYQQEKGVQPFSI